MMNENELTIINGGRLSYEARLLYLTVLLPNASCGKVTLDFTFMQLALSICRPNVAGITIQEKKPSVTDLQTWLNELEDSNLISLFAPLNSDYADTSAGTSASANGCSWYSDSNQKHKNLPLQPKFPGQDLPQAPAGCVNPLRPDEITEVPAYITCPADRGFDKTQLTTLATNDLNNYAASVEPWPLLVDKEEYQDTFPVSSPNEPADDNSHSQADNFLPDNSDPLAYMRHFARTNATGERVNSNTDSRDTLPPALKLGGSHSELKDNLNNRNHPDSTNRTSFKDGTTVILPLRLAVTQPSGRIFKMTRDWIPDETFNRLAAFSGLVGIGYSRAELNDFVTYWSTRETTCDNPGWIMKFIRFLRMSRYHQ